MKIRHRKLTDFSRTATLSFLIIIGIAQISSCKKFVQIPAPTTQLVTGSVFNNNGAASSALTVVYAQMFQSESYSMALNNGLLSDELTCYATSGKNFEFYTNAMVGTNYYGPWTSAYNYIYQANAIVQGLQDNVGVSPAVKQQLTGEAYFIRAFWHFYLTNCYGDVPLVTTTDYTVNSVLARTTRVQVLQQVIADLKNAQNLLNSNYVDVSDTTITTERTQPNRAAASALLARAYLYLGNYGADATAYVNAESAATAVIGNALYGLSPLTGNSSVFRANNSEAIWQLATPQPASFNTFDGRNFILLAAPSVNTGTSLSSQLLGSFEPGDQRKTNWVGSINAGGTTYYFPYKYKTYTYDGAEYTMVLRLAEQYLIRAEARAQQGNTSGALADLNVIRNRAGLANYGGTTDKASLLAAILHERQVELFTEWGHRWFDLNRIHNTNAVMSAVTPLKGGTWSSDGHQQLYPIPATEIANDSHLTQNSGY